MARNFKIPLNMVQRELNWLEKEGWLTVLFEGNKKNYYWNRRNRLVKPLRVFLKKIRSCENRKKKDIEIDPAFGLHLPLKERIRLCEELTQEGEYLSPYPPSKPFVKVFGSIDEYDKWKRKQTDPWLL